MAVAVAALIGRELDDDYVGLWVIPWHIRRKIDPVDDQQVRLVARAVLEGLSESGVELGTVSDDSAVFTAWPGHDGVERVLREWVALGRDPNIGEVAWLARD